METAVAELTGTAAAALTEALAAVEERPVPTDAVPTGRRREDGSSADGSGASKGDAG